ncbi:MAG: baseplate J/gp47 family protein [Rhizobiales bacterium]|nr:baseplate J/gp47 family protein [Hyphomicrobiales bacterium]
MRRWRPIGRRRVFRPPRRAPRCVSRAPARRAPSTFRPARARGGDIVFATLVEVTLAADATSVDVAAEATIAGVAANGVVAGGVGALLDPIGGVSVSNLTETEGGADIEDLEAWRLRLANAFERVSTGGSRAWYRETAIGVSSAIVDVGVIRPQPCYVDLYVLTRAGAAGEDLRAEVAAAFDTREALDIRFGDEVTVKAPVAVDVAPRLVLRVRGAGADIAAQAAAAAAPVLGDWSTRLGALVAPSDVEAAAKTLPGVVDAEIHDLSFRALLANEFLRPAPLVVEAISL